MHHWPLHHPHLAPLKKAIGERVVIERVGRREQLRQRHGDEIWWVELGRHTEGLFEEKRQMIFVAHFMGAFIVLGLIKGWSTFK